MTWLLRLFRGESGSTVVVFGAVAPTLVFFTLLASDYAGSIMLRDALQRLADGAALTGAQSLIVAGEAQSSVAISSATGYAESLAPSLPVEVTDFSADANVAAVDEATVLTVSLFARPKTLFAAFGMKTSVGVTASARPAGAKSLCVIGLARSGLGVSVAGSAKIEANGCMVHVNSDNRKALRLRGEAAIAAAQTGVVGGYDGPADAVKPDAVTDAPVLEDPLANRVMPTVGECDYTGRVITQGRETWSPGVYCDGIRLINGSEVILRPGVYIVKGGHVYTHANSKISGKGVTLYLVNGARLRISRNASLDMSAPASGLTAGLLIVSDPANPASSAHELHSDNAPNLLGAIYLPKAELSVGGDKTMADQSPWTAILADKITLNGNGRIVLNTRFSETPVPVPSTLLAERNVRLTR
jgi:hypothetical protein